MALSAPVSGFVAQGNSKFLVEGKASDETGLSSVTATISDLITGQIVATASTSLDGLEDQFSFEISAGDRYTATNSYMLRVAATDKAGNNGSAFANIVIIEFPLAFKGICFATNPLTNNWNIHSAIKESNGTFQIINGPTQMQDVSGLLSDNRNEFFAISQSNGGILSIFEQEQFDLLYENRLNVGTSFPVLVGLDMSRNSYFSPSQTPPYLRVFRFDGSSKGDIEDMYYPGTAVCITESKVFAGARGVLGSPIKLDAYNLENEKLSGSVGSDFEIEEIVSINDDLIASFGNLNGVGRVDICDAQSLIKDWELTLDGEFVAAAGGNGRIWVLTSTSLKEINPILGTFSAPIVTGNYYALAYDRSDNRLFLGTSSDIEMRTLDGTLLSRIAGSNGPVKMIKIIYNK